jgi:hypothetical protein
MNEEISFHHRLARQFTRRAVFATSILIAATAVMGTAYAADDAPAYRMKQSEFQPIRGTYTLENGMALRVYRQQGRFYAEFDNKRRLEMVAVSPTAFVAPANGQRFTFHEAPNGLVNTVSLSTSPLSMTAQVPDSQCNCVASVDKPNHR